ncbi:hypothetical protein Micbo1qcDRAFT_155059, partial [Microdochium bolleyi]
MSAPRRCWPTWRQSTRGSLRRLDRQSDASRLPKAPATSSTPLELISEARLHPLSGTASSTTMSSCAIGLSEASHPLLNCYCASGGSRRWRNQVSLQPSRSSSSMVRQSRTLRSCLSGSTGAPRSRMKV